MIRELYYGDNLQVMREQIPDEHVDLVYLDPPFKSDRDYNLLFRTPKGEPANAQVVAFQDTWHWGRQAEAELADILNQPNTQVTSMISAIIGFLGRNDMTAYIVMMASRLLELHRVLKPTGSLYLHCDPTASHYLKILLDSVFGPINFRNEVIWRRAGAHNKCERWGPIHDVILFYSKSDNYVWTNPKRPYMLGHVKEHFIADADGYKTNYYGNVLTGSGTRSGESGQPWMGINPTLKGRHWAIPGKLWDETGFNDAGLTQHQKLDKLLEAGFITIEPGSEWPIYERRIKNGEGPATGDIWAYQPYTEKTVFGTEECIDSDVSWIKPRSHERLGYPTQKPVGLLQRMISASSNEQDIVLDPFCGCGTAVHAAESLNRQWIGIDITHLAIALIEKRLYDSFPGIQCAVHGTPRDLDSAHDLAERNKYQFQYWACSLVKAQPFGGKKKGADTGIDGLIYFKDDIGAPKKVIVSVKGGKNINVSMIRELKAVKDREKAAIGLFICLADPTGPMTKEAASAGFYEIPDKTRRFPRIQILTIADLLSGAKPNYPDLSLGQATFKQAPVAQKKQDKKTLWD